MQAGGYRFDPDWLHLIIQVMGYNPLSLRDRKKILRIKRSNRIHFLYFAIIRNTLSMRIDCCSFNKVSFSVDKQVYRCDIGLTNPIVLSVSIKIFGKSY